MKRSPVVTRVDLRLSGFRVGEGLLIRSRDVRLDLRVQPVDPIDVGLGQLNRRQLLVADKRCDFGDGEIAEGVNAHSTASGKMLRNG